MMREVIPESVSLGGSSKVQLNIPLKFGWPSLQVEKKSVSKVLDRSYVEMAVDGVAGKISRKEAIAAVAKELGVPAENIGLIGIDGQSGTTRVVAKFHVYGSPESKKKVHPRYLDERMLTKEEREKLKQERKKAAVPAAAAAATPEAKK
jgi:ribosomal protein S24E